MNERVKGWMKEWVLGEYVKCECECESEMWNVKWQMLTQVRLSFTLGRNVDLCLCDLLCTEHQSLTVRRNIDLVLKWSVWWMINNENKDEW